ncbi:hypothetical protein [Acidipila sp. EB88]|uniref:hypothetical protein n=1 Tax=Acidipila sp. EB88 TaxID=2305226 RepID=UPI000F5DF524|nr:hypothetical protein [Acidipila sp. EB88]
MHRAPVRSQAAGLLLLLLLATRLLARAPYAQGGTALLASLAAMVASLLLGGSLWWVCKRQVGGAGAAVALLLYAAAPRLVFAGSSPYAALGLFAMLYTAIGVAHALQGPRRKWPKRIVLMALLAAFTAAASPLACAVGLALALCSMLYLAEGRRSLLPALFALWIGVAALACALRTLAPAGLLHAQPIVWTPAQRPWLLHSAGTLLALAASTALWAVSRRSRYFGNTAPLAASVVLLGVAYFAAQPLWLLPYPLLFIAGVVADGLESRHRHLWVLISASACLLQLVLACTRYPGS